MEEFNLASPNHDRVRVTETARIRKEMMKENNELWNGFKNSVAEGSVGTKTPSKPKKQLKRVKTRSSKSTVLHRKSQMTPTQKTVAK